MKRFNEEFKTSLYETIKDIENNSLVEVVSIIKAQSGKYRDVSLWFGLAVLLVFYTFFMFAPIDFYVSVIYLFTILSFFVGYFFLELVPSLKRKFINQKKLEKSAEIYARAIFQKGGIRFTKDKIGVLIYVSLFEKKVTIIADRGAETYVPDEEWTNIKSGFQNIFDKSSITTAFIEELSNCKAIFSQYIPPIENDINELPDDLEVEL